MSRVLLAGLTVALVAGSLLRPRPAAKRRDQSPRLGDDHVVIGDGIRLPLAAWRPDAPPRAIVLGVHGYGDYRQAFGLAGPWLAERGLAVLAYDQRGFGESGSRGYWPGADVLIDDLADVVAAVREAHPELPLVVLGESMGGSVALASVIEGKAVGVDRLILAAPGVRPDNAPLRQVHDLALKLGTLALPWLAVELRRGARPWLAAEESMRLADDPLILRELHVGTYEGLIELAKRASAEPPRAMPPTLILYGELDSTIARQAIDDLAARLESAATLRIYPDHYHMLLHEARVDAVLTDCLAWLAADAGAEP